MRSAVPKRHKISTLLPDEVRSELDRQLIASGFSGYSALAGWLEERGYEISRSAIARYGKSLQQKIEAIQQATDQARAIAESCPDDEGLLLDAAQRLAQHQIYEALLAIEIDTSNIGADQLTKLIRALADLGRGSVALKKYQQEVRDRIRDAAAKVKGIAHQGGLSESAIAQIELELGSIG